MTTRSTVVPNHVHGTTNGYVNYRCRCADCRRANSVYMKKRRKARVASNLPVPHGTDNGYVNYSCRCTDCRSAHNASSRRRR